MKQIVYSGFVRLRENLEKGTSLKKSGKTWKTQGMFRPFLQQGKLREFYSAKYL